MSSGEEEGVSACGTTAADDYDETADDHYSAY